MSAFTTMIGPFEVLAPALRKHRRSFFLAIGSAIGAQAVGVPLPLLARRAVDAMAKRSAAHDGVFSASEIAWFSVVLAAIVLVRGALRWIQGAQSGAFAQGVIADTRIAMYEHLLRLSAGFFARRAAGRVVVRFVGDANALQAWLSKICIGVPADLITLAILVGAIGAISPYLLLAASVPTVLIAPVLFLINPLARLWTRTARRAQSRLCGRLTERMAVAGQIKSLNLQQADAAAAAGQLTRIAEANVRRARIEALGDALLLSGSTAGIAAVVAVGAWQLPGGFITHGSLFAALWLALLARSPLARLARANIIHQRARVSAERIRALLDREAEPGWSKSALPYSGPGRTIRFRDIGYMDASKRWVFHGVRRKIDGPGLLSISGSADAGTLLLELLLRLRRPHVGRIYLDGQDIRRLRAADVRHCMGWAPRDPMRWEALHDLCGAEQSGRLARLAGEIYESISTETSAPSPRQARRAAETRLEKLCHALAIATSNNPPILLLDEPTAGLDDNTVARLVAWIREQALHRLVLVATSDRRLHDVANDHWLIDCPVRVIPADSDAIRFSTPDTA